MKLITIRWTSGTDMDKVLGTWAAEALNTFCWKYLPRVSVLDSRPQWVRWILRFSFIYKEFWYPNSSDSRWDKMHFSLPISQLSISYNSEVTHTPKLLSDIYKRHPSGWNSSNYSIRKGGFEEREGNCAGVLRVFDQGCMMLVRWTMQIS